MNKLPKISVLLCTARPPQSYIEHPEWDCLGKIVDDLSKQTFKDFELIIVDGLHAHREAPKADFPIYHIPPRETLWTRNKKVAICAYRNTGLAIARGELVVNLDDCCELGPEHLACYWRAWSVHNICLAACWPEQVIQGHRD